MEQEANKVEKGGEVNITSKEGSDKQRVRSRIKGVYIWSETMDSKSEGGK